MTGALLAVAALTGCAGFLAVPAAAAPLAVSVEARMAGHIGWEETTGTPAPDAGDCARYGSAAASITTGSIGNAGGSSGTAGTGFTDGATGWVAAGTVAYSAHGNSGTGGCGGAQLDLSRQSALGFEPAAVASIESGVAFNLGRMVHRNNQLFSLVNDWFHGSMDIRMLGQELRYDWALNETPNGASPASDPANDDVVEFLNTIPDAAFTGTDGHRYTLVVSGFTDPQPDGTCAATLTSPADAVDRFVTVEQTSTYGCLYAELTQVRALTVVKIAEGDPAAIPAFAFTSTSDGAGSPWASGFALQPSSTGAAGAASITRDVAVGERVTITETTPSDGWTFTSLRCVDGLGASLPVTDGAAIDLGEGLQTPDPAAAPITCTYTNTFADDPGTPTPTPTPEPSTPGPTPTPEPSTPAPDASTPAPSATPAGGPPTALPLTDGAPRAGGALARTGAGPILPFALAGGGLLLVGSLTLASVLRARRRA